MNSEEEANIHALQTNHMDFNETDRIDVTDLIPELHALNWTTEIWYDPEINDVMFSLKNEKGRKEYAEEVIKKRKELLERKEWEKKLEQDLIAYKNATERDEKRQQESVEEAHAKQERMQGKAKKIAEEMRRKKLEKQRVKEQIARDRAEREAKATMNTRAKPLKPATPSQSASSNTKEDGRCKLQFRCKDGKRVVQSFPATDTLQQVLLKMGFENQTFMTTYPKKVYGIEEKNKTLQELGLAPSAVLTQASQFTKITDTMTFLSPILLLLFL